MIKKKTWMYKLSDDYTYKPKKIGWYDWDTCLGCFIIPLIAFLIFCGVIWEIIKVLK